MLGILKRLGQWLELNLSWFVVNGYKQEKHCEYLKKKYSKNENSRS